MNANQIFSKGIDRPDTYAHACPPKNTRNLLDHCRQKCQWCQANLCPPAVWTGKHIRVAAPKATSTGKDAIFQSVFEDINQIAFRGALASLAADSARMARENGSRDGWIMDGHHVGEIQGNVPFTGKQHFLMSLLLDKRSKKGPEIPKCPPPPNVLRRFVENIGTCSYRVSTVVAPEITGESVALSRQPTECVVVFRLLVISHWFPDQQGCTSYWLAASC